MGLNAEHSWADAPIVGHLWEVNKPIYWDIDIYIYIYIYGFGKKENSHLIKSNFLYNDNAQCLSHFLHKFMFVFPLVQVYKLASEQ